MSVGVWVCVRGRVCVGAVGRWWDGEEGPGALFFSWRVASVGASGACVGVCVLFASPLDWAMCVCVCVAGWRVRPPALGRGGQCVRVCVCVCVKRKPQGEKKEGARG